MILDTLGGSCWPAAVNFAIDTHVECKSELKRCVACYSGVRATTCESEIGGGPMLS